MRLTVLGSTAGAPSRTNPASGYLLEHGDVSIWLDAGTGTFMELAKRIDPGSLDAVVLSHLHVDHCSDLFGLYGYLAYGPSGDVPVKVFAPIGAAAHLGAFARASDEHVFNHVLDIEEVAPGDEVTASGVTLKFGEAIHPVPALVTGVEAGGVSLVYSGDTGPGSALMQMSRGADVLLCEASLQGDRDSQTYPFHLTAREAGEAADSAGVGRLIVTHIGALMDPGRSVDEAAGAFTGPVEYAAQGSVFEIEGRE
ncbi:MAG: MBL fold metallo-hydrolase [Actinomycetota bacterium]|nr:MBL fold metallo-hydrolase [Actinomycetota bacterium]MDK1017429.1 MBL fold metallo-hydrolase [Actinomycetota bacterium]MDK1039023.1 MBL fold metallo-hydrolase [Actinomycetota bacterium]MDK1097565.1 MBL fold metallo-hydrolase [Actinomycetota bacterium]MDK1291483.1 MBL fold metallo-hydrolase [Actinomycetota bacterium]